MPLKYLLLILIALVTFSHTQAETLGDSLWSKLEITPPAESIPKDSIFRPQALELGENQLDALKTVIDKFKDIPVPEPASTPYDADPVARKVYMEAYRAAYRKALGGSYLIICGDFASPHYRGHRDGGSAVRGRMDNQRKDSAPTKKEK